MMIEVDRVDPFWAVSQELRDSTWDLVEAWLSETGVSSECLINDLPTLLGGIAKIINEPALLADLEPGGELYIAARNFGLFRQEAGFKIGRLMADFSVLRQTVWHFLKPFKNPRAEHIRELERRVETALDMIASVAVDAFWSQAASELVALSAHDKLTGFLHAQVFAQRLSGESARSRRYGYPLAVMRVDVDDFGAYNKKEGRLAGNRLLRLVADEIRGQIRLSDIAARLEADEFAVLLPQTDLEGAKRAGERVRRRVRRIQRGEGRLTTVSIGAAVLREDAPNLEVLMDSTAVALSAARNDGGDLVRLV